MKPMIAGLCACCVLWGAKKTEVVLPAPYATPSVKNGPTVVARPPGAELHVPAQFRIEEYASGFDRPRFLLEGPAGEVLVSDTVAKGSVFVLENGRKSVLLSGLDRPYGMAFWKDYLYVGEPTSIKRYKYDAVARAAGPGEEVVSLAGYDKGHVTRTIAL